MAHDIAGEDHVGLAEAIAPVRVDLLAAREAGADADIQPPGIGLPALMYAQLNLPLPQLSESRAELGSVSDNVIACGMAKQREERYDNGGELAVAARAALAGVENAGQPGRLRAARSLNEPP